MIASEIRVILHALIAQTALFTEENFTSRADALDELEFHVLDRLNDLLAVGPSVVFTNLRKRAEVLKARLETVDDRLFHRLRTGIRTGHYTPTTLRGQLAAYAGPAGWTNEAIEATSYDNLDVLTNGLFIELDQPPLVEVREPEMIYYQKTPARIIWELAAKLTDQDTFYDLGSGLGQVPLLVRLLSGATVKGVEIEPAYCRYAQACTDALRLSRVEFLNADARSVAYADGTAFFLFTPFTGGILQSVLEQLRLVAQKQSIKLFSYGPGTQALTQQPWLQRLDAPERHLYQLAEFRSCSVVYPHTCPCTAPTECCTSAYHRG